MGAIGGDGRPRQFEGLVTTRRIGEYPAVSLSILAGNHNACFVGLFSRAYRRVDRDHHPDERGSRAGSRTLNNAAVPQRARHVFEQLCFEFLAPEPRPLIFPDYLLEETLSEIDVILVRRS